MATRRAEWLAAIKPIIERDDAKRDAKELAKELGDILEVKVDASPENLSELSKEFNAQLKTMGKQPIVFSEKTLGGIVAQFANAIAGGVSQGIINGARAGMEESLQQLRLQQAELKKERARIQTELNKKVPNKENMKRLFDFDGESVKSLEVDGDALEEAKKQYNEFLKIGREFNKVQKEHGVDSKEYLKALYDAESALHDLYRMRKTLQKLETPVPTSLKAAYGLLDPYTEQPKYEQKMEEAGKTPKLPFYETNAGELVGESWEKYAQSIQESQKQLVDIDNQMSAIDAKIIDVTKSIQAAGSAVIATVNNEKDGLKTLNEIEAAYKRLKVDKGTKLKQQNELHIKSALDFDPSKNNVGIKTFAKDYYDAAASGDWVEEYHALLKYVKLYESYITSANKTHQNKVTAKNNPFTPLYEQLKPMAANARNMLQNILNMGEDKPLVGMGGAGTEDGKSGPTSEEVINAQKIREEAEAKAKAEREAFELTRQKREEEEKLAKAAEKRKLAEEAATEARKEELGLMQAMEKFQGAFEKTDKKNETLAFINTKTGDMSDLAVGDAHGVTMEAGTSRKMSQAGYDMEIHSHSWKTAAPSIEDFEEWFNQLEYIKKFGIRAGEELLAFDFSKLDPTKFQEVIQKYKDLDENINAQFKSMSMEEKMGKFGSYQGMQEAVQAMLRQGLEGILQDIPNVMKSIKMPELPVANLYSEPKQDTGSDVRSLADVFANANEEVKKLIKNYAILAQKGNAMTDDEYDRFIEIGDKLDEVSPDVLLAPASKLNDFAKQFANDGNVANVHLKNSDAIKQEAVSYEELKQRVEAYFTIRQKMFSLMDQSQPWVHLIPDVDAAKKNITNLFPETGDKTTTTANMVGNMFESTNQTEESTLKTLASLLGIEIPQAAQQATEAVDGLNNSLEETRQLTSKESTSPSVGSISLEEVDKLRAENESLREDSARAYEYLDEKDRELQDAYRQLEQKEIDEAYLDSARGHEEEYLKQISELERKLAMAGDNDQLRTQIDALRQENKQAIATADYYRDAYEEARQFSVDTETSLNAELTSLRTQLEDEQRMRINTENALSDTISEKWSAEKRAEEAEAKAKQAVKNFTGTSSEDNQQGFVSTELEATLTKVFANILNPQTQQNDSEQKQSPWALENTLQAVKGVLDNIQTNTSKARVAETANVDTIAGTALDGRLTEIKTVLESIDNKIAKGGVITKKDDDSTNNTRKDKGANKQTSRAADIKSLTKDYERLAKLSAQFKENGNLEIKATIDNLKDEIRIKRDSLNLTMDENQALREKYANASKAEARLLAAAKAQQKINDQRKAADKDAKQQAKDIETEWKRRVKDAQRATGINAATSTANAGDQTVVRAIGTEGVSKDIENKARELSDQIKALRVLRDEIDKKGEKASDDDRDKLSKQISKVKELKTEVDGYLKIHEKYNSEDADDLGDASHFGSVGTDQYWNNITAAIKNATSGKATIKELNADTGELTGTTKIAANTFATWSATVDPLTGRLKMLRTGIKKTETIFEQLTRKTKEIFTYFGGSSIVFRVFNEFKKGIQYVRDIDLALTELKKVTDETEETYDAFLQTAAKTGARLGATISAVTEATATFAKLGYSMDMAAEMAEAAIVYKNVGDNITSTEDAADSIISTMKGFGLEASEAMTIVDRFNEVGNRFAITSQGIGEALRLSASALNEGGNSIDESIGLITAANEVVNDPNSVGTALKTLTLRLRGAKTELEEMGEDVSDMATTTSSLQAKLLALTGGQVDIMADENTFKNSTQILREMADAWENMTDIQRAAALELMGGKRQANVLSALIQNFDTVEKAIETSANSSGSALKENERYLDSIQGKVDQFNNAVQSMWSNALDSDFVKNVVAFGTELMKVIDKVGLLNSVLLTLGAYVGFRALFKSLSASGLTLNMVTKALWGYATGINTVNIANIKQIATEKILRAEWIKTLAVQHLKNKAAKAGIVISDATIKKYVEQMTTTKLLTAATKGLGTTLLTVLKTIAPLAAITVGIVGAIHVVDALTKTTEELKEEYDELNNTLSETESKLSNLESELSNINDRIKEINSQDSLSFVDQEELSRLKSQSAELERQIALNKTLKEQQQTQMNESALTMANNYADVGKTTGKTTGELAAGGGKGGAVVGGVVGGIALGGKIGAAIGTLIPIPVIGNIIGYAAGALVGAAVGAAIGAAGGMVIGESEEKVGDSLDNIKEQHDKLLADFNSTRDKYRKDPSKKNKEKFDEAQKALQDYEAATADYLSQMDSYYSQIDWESATEEQRQAMQDFYDKQDQWAIQSNSPNAKSNAIARIFGDEASKELKIIKERMQEAAEAGEEISLSDAFNGDEEAYNAFKTRLYNIGLTVYETEQYFKEEQKAAEDAIDAIETYDAIKNIQNLTSGVNDLKNAFKELHEEGLVSAETLLGLESVFGDTDGWKEFFEVMSSGTATMEQAEDVAKILAENHVDKILSSGKLSDEEQLVTISHLQSLGITNAREFLNAKMKKDAIEDIVSNGVLTKEEKEELATLQKQYDNGGNQGFASAKERNRYYALKSKEANPDTSNIISQIKEQYGITLDSEEDRLLIEKAITAEKLKQEAIDKQAAKNAYETALGEYNTAKEKNDTIDDKIEQIPDNFEGLKNKYGVSKGVSGRYGITQYYYKGKKYTYLSDVQKAIKADLEGQKVELPDVPAEVTEIDVTNAETAAETAVNELQNELNKHGLALALDLIGFDEKIDTVQDVYSTLKNIATEYNTQGYLSLDNLQALLQLTPEYLAVLQMENGQITINQQALEGMLQTKLAEAEATAVQTAITQLSALAERKQAIEISNSAVAANQASIELGTYSSMLGTVAQDAIIAAGSVTAFNNALRGAQDNAFVSDDEINQILSNFNNSVDLINSVRENLPSSFNNVLDPGSKTTGEEVAESEWDKLIAKYENRLALITNERDLIEAEIDKAEARGEKASAKYYDDLIRTAAEEKTLLEEQYEALKSYLEANEDTIDQDTWTEYNNTLNDVAVAIKECETNTISWQEALREIDMHYFEQATDEISRLGTELELVDSLLEDKDVADENGNWSSAALTRMAMYANMIEQAAVDTQRYQSEIAKLEEQYKDGELSEEQYQDRLATLTDGLYDSINAQNDARDSIVELNEARIDAIKEGIEKEIEAYEDLIDAKKEELDAERDLYDFRNNIKKQTKDISELERRIASLSGSSAASDIAERRRLEAQLMEAKEGLNDTYYDHSRDTQSSALDDEAEAYRQSQEKRIEKLEETLDNIELLIQNSMMDVLFNADIVYNELNGIADIYGITLSEELTQPWKDASAQATKWKDELKLSMTSGEYAALIGKGGAITVFANGVGSKLSGSWNTAKTAVEKYSNFLTGTGLGNKFSSTITGFANQIQKIIDKWNGVKTAADNAYQAQLRVQNVGGNSNVGGGGGSGGGSGNTSGNLQPSTPPPAKSVDDKILKKYKLTSQQVLALGYGPIDLWKFEQLLKDYQIKYSAKYKQVANTQAIERSLKKVLYGEYITGPFAVRQYAKGTVSTTRDEWAIDSEPQFGDELVLVPTEAGNLSYMRKGTGVVPADMTKKLFELAQIPTSDLMHKNLTAVVPSITKNDFKNEFNFESLVHVDTVDSDTLPKLEKMVDKKIDDFSRALNYSLKKFAR